MYICAREVYILVYTLQCVNKDVRKCVVSLYGWGVAMAEMFTEMMSTIKSA